MTVYDDPNREALGLDPAWVEGEGGEPGAGGGDPQLAEQAADESEKGGLDSMTKDELLAYARDIGANPANAGMSKDELRASIDKAEAG